MSVDSKAKVLIFTCVVLFLMPYICRAQTITLEQLQSLVQNSPDIKIAQKEFNISKAQVDINQSELSPTLFGSVTYTNYSNPVQTSTYNVSTVNQNGSTNSYSETLTPQQQRYNNISANLGLSMHCLAVMKV